MVWARAVWRVGRAAAGEKKKTKNRPVPPTLLPPSIPTSPSDKCSREKRKTVNGDDLLWALSTLGFECYVEPLKAYLAKFRDAEKAAAQATGAAGGGGEDGGGDDAAE